MPRLIDADAVLDTIRDYFVELIEEKAEEYGEDEIPFGVINPYLEMNKALRTKVKQIPTADAVEVIRCKDCDDWIGDICRELRYGDPNGYCAWAERKKDAEEE